MQDQSSPSTSEELRQHVLAQLETGKKAIEELNEQELEAVTGGGFFSIFKMVEKPFTRIVDASRSVGIKL